MRDIIKKNILAEIFEKAIPPTMFTLKWEQTAGNYKWCWHQWKCELKYKTYPKETKLEFLA
jgi:hypothetical protein